MRRLRAAVAALAIGVAVTGQALAEPPEEDAQPAAVQPTSTSLPEAAGVVAGAVLLQAALAGMALILFPNLRRRGHAMPSAAVHPGPRR